MDARVILLTLNPGWEPGGAERDAAIAGYTVENLAALTFESNPPVWCVAPALAATGGGRYWTRRLRPLIEHVGLGPVSTRLAWVQFVPYASPTFRDLPETLPSQRFTFELVRDAIGRGLLFVVLRAWGKWSTAVPELERADLVFAKSPRVSSVSPGNLGAAEFARVVNALRADV